MANISLSNDDNVFIDDNDDTPNNTIAGNDGNDFIGGKKGDDFLLGNNGNDTLFGGQGNDTIFGGGDDDFIRGAKGDDLISGDRGNDRLQGDEGADTFQFLAEHAKAALDEVDIVLDFDAAEGDSVLLFAEMEDVVFVDSSRVEDSTVISGTLMLIDAKTAAFFDNVAASTFYDGPATFDGDVVAFG
jgi:hypothetical protein